MNLFKTGIPLLALAQAIAQSGSIHLTTTGALIGLTLSGSEALSTWPASAIVLTTLSVTIPASFFMARYGRKAGFLLGFAVGIGGALLAIAGITLGNFITFTVGAGMMGFLFGFAGYLRFAAVELVEPEWKSRAISLVLAGGVIAAFLGPSLSKWGLTLVSGAVFAGGYILWLPLALFGAVLISFARFKPATQTQLSIAHSIRHLVTHATLPGVIVLGTGAYVVMAMIMTATPLAMHHHHMGFEATTQVIRSHMLGMFVPSFFTGHLIRYLGVRTIIVLGSALYAACIAINFMGIGYWQFLSSLVLLGVGWNFLFVAASQLLTARIAPEYQSAAQALNDFVIASGIALSIAFTGKMHEVLGWQWLNMVTIPVILLLVAIGYRLSQTTDSESKS
ncbi:MAG: MFS transporter [Turneriella sp.]